MPTAGASGNGESASSGVTKLETTYKPWSTERPKDGQIVKINYVLYLADEHETVVEDSRKRRKQPFSFLLGSTDVIEGINVAVRSFGQGERSKLRISSDFAYGELT
jgi:FKBP-type peptidyl-prolyl cis-trans isomerase 2